jgi:outer membrane protein assembly factor BamB
MNLVPLIFGLTFLSAVVFGQPIEEPELMWRQALGGVALTRPVEQLESIVLVCEGGTVKALGGSGTMLWEYRTGGKLLPFIARSGNGSSYVCRNDGIFHAINRAGRQLWKVNLQGKLAAPPLIGWDDRIFVFLPKKLYCFTASGNRLWQAELESPLALDPIADKSGGFAAVLADGSLIRANAFGKMSTVQLSAVPFAIMTLAPAETRNRPASTRFIAVHSDGRLEIVEDGGSVERSGLPVAPVAAAERDGFLAALLANGDLMLISPEDGPVWSIKTGFAKQDDKVEVEWNERGIHLLSKNGGEGYSLEGVRRWSLSLSGSATTPVLNGKGVMYSCGNDWILYAYRVENVPALFSDKEIYSFGAGGYYGLGEEPSKPEFPQGFEFLLNMAEARIRAGNLGEMEPAYTKLLLSISGWENMSGQQNSFENIRLRVRSLRLLGIIGSRETIPLLVRFFRREQNLIVKGAAAEAIGAIGVDPEGRALDAFAEILPGTYLEERLLVSIAASTGKLCRFSGPPLSLRGIPLLVSLTDPSQPGSVRRRAERELAATIQLTIEAESKLRF